MEQKSNRLQRFEEILKEHDSELFMYFSPKSQMRLNDINPRDLLATALRWSNLSAQGLLCGILGCSEEPDTPCSICSCHYCLEHIPWHFHSVENSGILEKDSSEMR